MSCGLGEIKDAGLRVRVDAGLVRGYIDSVSNLGATAEVVGYGPM